MSNIKYSNAKNAAGVKGIIIFSAVDNKPMFRVYDKHNKDKFVDYRIWHHDLAVTIDIAEVAMLYEVRNTDNGETYDVIDYTPETLGIDIDYEFCPSCGSLVMYNEVAGYYCSYDMCKEYTLKGPNSDKVNTKAISKETKTSTKKEWRRNNSVRR